MGGRSVVVVVVVVDGASILETAAAAAAAAEVVSMLLHSSLSDDEDRARPLIVIVGCGNGLTMRGLLHAADRRVNVLRTYMVGGVDVCGERNGPVCEQASVSPSYCATPYRFF